MARRDDYISAGKVAKSVDDKKKGKDKRGGFLGLFFRHPAVVLITISTVLAITIAFTAYMLYSANVQLDYILEQYMNLSVKRADSKSDFNKKLFYIQVDENGIVNITVNLPTGFDKEDESDFDTGRVEDENGDLVIPPLAQGSVPNSNISNSEVAQKLKDAYPTKYEEMALVWELMHNTFQSNADYIAIGLMANIANEGGYGVVEGLFAISHKDGVSIPSTPNANWGSNTMKTIRDVEYFNKLSSSISCGVGSVQWSHERRITFTSICLKYMKSDSDVNDVNWAKAEAEMLVYEIHPGSGYYKDVSGAVGKAGNTVENWAEAFADYYEICDGYCGKGNKMTGSGAQCKSRRNNATNIASLLGVS